MAPSFTVQCGSTSASTSFCLAARSSGLSLSRALIGICACQPVRSLPLKRAVNPAGGVLSCAAPGAATTAITLAAISQFLIAVLLINVVDRHQYTNVMEEYR